MSLYIIAILASRSTGIESYLTKKVDESYLNRKFSDLLEKLVDEQPDQINCAYSEKERILAKDLGTLLEMKRNNPHQIDIGAQGEDPEFFGPSYTIYLDHLVSEHPPGVVHPLDVSEFEESDTKPMGICLLIEEVSHGCG